MTHFVAKMERLTTTASELAQFDWYHNMKMPRTLYSELRLRAYYPLRRTLGKLILGNRRYAEYGYSAYTCLTQGARDQKIS